MKITILQYNLPALTIPVEQVISITPYNNNLLSIELNKGERILSYCIKFENYTQHETDKIIPNYTIHTI